ncbi:MAG: hypothetical protein SCK28_05580 [Bacillota bacterium]|nr:hypothetical protein [Bacillota bacterium]
MMNNGFGLLVILGPLLGLMRDMVIIFAGIKVIQALNVYINRRM